MQNIKKHILPFVLACAMVFAVCTVFFAVSAKTFLLGDANRSGKIDAADYAMVKRHYLKTYRLDEEQQLIADCNHNSKIDAADYAMIKRHYLKTFELKGAVTIDHTPSEGLKYQLNEDEDGYEVVGIGTCKDTAIVIPAEYNGKPVKGVVGSEWMEGSFYGNDSITSVYISDGVEYIGREAFAGCKSLTSVSIPSSVTEIAYASFYGCKNLNGIILPENIKSIGNEAFFCTGIYEDTKNWENDALYIGDYLIEARWGIDGKHTVKAGTKLIADLAFYEAKIEELTLPAGLAHIGAYAFAYCTRLAKINLPDSLETIGDHAFYDNAVTEITIPAGLKELNNYAFGNCSNLTEVTLQEGLKHIGSGAFRGCAVKRVCIPASVAEIYSCPFQACAQLEKIEVAVGNKEYKSVNNCLIEIAAKTLVQGCKTSVIPADGSVTVIGSSSFSGCTGLAGITIPDCVSEIRYSAFNGSGLTSISLPDSVTKINDYAFAYAESLSKIDLGKNITDMGWHVFYHTAYYYDDSNWTGDEELIINGYTVETQKDHSQGWPQTGDNSINIAVLLIVAVLSVLTAVYVFRRRSKHMVFAG